MTERDAEILSLARTACGPQVRLVACRPDFCIKCDRDVTDVPLGKRLMVWFGELESARGGVLCESCWHEFIEQHPDDVKLEPFRIGGAP